mmetsp:Transcript_980/g.1295  ORF Transcript_980/g.1295 Transcript_980/m.1295 type:complete len:286 (-) Transcript_980:1983-2840(-)|eukprot:CAMPEP_0170128568 /NCGR_PEP_ID=MMETSP0020_2-20130122/21250_1 /TAXON_ID=98059 /ORGANISM="Dinobryon sp., Strain UTEXLB2267" /LENGTH=285 /DNA_ID=CAMNT_0010362517 /DNA_START=84 /DNA_END=941 /DNA_ORIENTATION=+
MDLDSELNRLSSIGDLYQVQKLLQDPDIIIDFQDESGYTALIWSSYRGYTEIVVKLIESGADVNLRTHGGNSALTLASNEGHLPVVNLLIQAGADLNVADRDGETALYNASKKGYTDIVVTLLRAGADISMRNKDGFTARKISQQLRHSAICNLLSENEKDPKTRRNSNFHFQNDDSSFDVANLAAAVATLTKSPSQRITRHNSSNNSNKLSPVGNDFHHFSATTTSPSSQHYLEQGTAYDTDSEVEEISLNNGSSVSKIRPKMVKKVRRLSLGTTNDEDGPGVI